MQLGLEAIVQNSHAYRTSTWLRYVAVELELGNYSYIPSCASKAVAGLFISAWRDQQLALPMTQTNRIANV